MRTYSVIISDPAEADLRAIYDYVAARGGAEIALGFIERIEGYCLGFAHTPERGTRRDDLGARTADRRISATCHHFVRGA